jgi:DNA invertase Pin-like site-specific DNA recombinase
MNIREGVTPSYGVKSHHLKRKAVLYVRQSTNKQVVENIGSTTYQRGLAAHLHASGWRPDQVEIVEDDLARSGRDITRRPGYHRIVREIQEGYIGIIAMSNVERGGREAIAWFLLFKLCEHHDVLVSIDGRIHDVSDRNNRVMLKLAAVLAENDSEMRTENFMRGRIAKARMGSVVSPVPTGYVRQRDGSLTIDPTPGVAQTITRVFAEYLRQGSLVKTVRALRAAGIRVPGRRLGQEVQWAEADRSNVRRILRNPTYVGDYEFGRTRLEPALGFMKCGAPRWRRTAIDERIVTVDHHPALVSREDFERVQRLLTRNQCGRWGTQSHDSLLHGIAVCAIHGSRLEIHYGPLRADGTRQHFYVCPGDVKRGERQCVFVRGRVLDSLVRRAFLERLERPQLEGLREAAARLREEALGERFLRESEENRLRQKVADLKYRYGKIDADNRFVAAECEKELESALRDLDRVLRNPKPATLNDGEEVLREAMDIAGYLPSLFDASTTTTKERKELVAALIQRVAVGPCSRDAAPLRIEWRDVPDDLVVEAPLLGYCERIALGLRKQGLSFKEIAERMNADGLRNRNDCLWTKFAIIQAIERAERRSLEGGKEVDEDAREGANT